MKPARFYPIVPDIEWLKILLSQGVRFKQLRIKDETSEKVTEILRYAIPLARLHGATLVVNDYWRQAIDLKAEYVHLGQEDIADADVAAIKKAGIFLGISTHDEAELDNALAYKPDYVALGPVYETKLKAMKWSPQGLDRVTQWKKMVGNTPLVGIGGITLERAAGVLNAGADSVSVVTDITLNANPQQRIKAWLQI